MNKKAAGMAYAWVFGLVSLFGLGVLYIVFSQVFTGYLVPIIKNQANTTITDPAIVAEVFYGIDRYMVYFNILPFIIFFTIVVYMIVVAIRKEREGDL